MSSLHSQKAAFAGAHTAVGRLVLARLHSPHPTLPLHSSDTRLPLAQAKKSVNSGAVQVNPLREHIETGGRSPGSTPRASLLGLVPWEALPGAVGRGDGSHHRCLGSWPHPPQRYNQMLTRINSTLLSKGVSWRKSRRKFSSSDKNMPAS